MFFVFVYGQYDSRDSSMAYDFRIVMIFGIIFHTSEKVRYDLILYKLNIYCTYCGIVEIL